MVISCPLNSSAFRPPSCVPCRKSGTPCPPPSRPRPFRRFTTVATCSRPPRPAPARPRRSRCRCCSASTPSSRIRAARGLRACSCSCRRASSPRRSASPSQDFGRHLHQRTILIFGGVSPRPQLDALRQGVDIVVATPGRLLDHINERAVDLTQGPPPRARRSRPHARHGLHPRHPPRARGAAETATEPALLRDVLGRDPHARQGPAARSAHRRSRAAQRARPSSSSIACTWWSRARSGRC